ncbi:response regulator [Ruminiclostridium cellulolyticum]|uniref:Stage 0 sporulation protein A homolog n=1 Tax=Ruminiclostridium cellulolyticum (strain ATCC 35319 / DSM 5812 / JCM 6584 / H10) TaxID=394503 RepID=B8I997_RUMCH|nr:response regulator [Ruminiclostridium cellulolyticum]ACL75357.1 two component transcriptional regulator, AraC family [Ruminiclostridium cellulolyticum H10]
MLKIMIIDDEFYFREALKVSIPWKEYGFEICGEAKNGKDALERVADLNPDIMIVDINMPIIDGLEFIQSVKEKGIESKFIILTGHSEFNYAKQAVQLGVNNYILKPVNEEELKSSLFEIKEVISKERNVKFEFEGLKQQVRDSLPLLKDKFLNELIQGSLIPKENETLKKMEYLKININSDYYLVITIELDCDESTGWDNEEKQLWKFAVSNISSEIMGEKFIFDICYDIDDRICIIVGIDGAQNIGDFLTLLESRLELIRSAICKHLDFTVTMGVGSEKTELFDIPISYKESIIALKNKLTLGKNRIILYSLVAESGIKGTAFSGEYRNKLLMNIRTADEEEVNKLISQIFMRVRGENIHHQILFVVCIEMVAACMEAIVEMGLHIEDIITGNSFNIIEEIQSKKSIDEMENWIKDIFKHTLETIKRNKISKASRLIEEVKNYISSNYQSSELSIDEIARNLFVNYAHLCFIFKRDTGFTINEYLTEFRIKKAKELFDSGNTLILDVASKVGYADASYFGKCFKKYYGLAPSKFIENIRKT